MEILRENRAFTLIELIFVILVIGVLAGVALPRFTHTIEKSRTAEAINILQTLRNAQAVYSFENSGTYAGDPDDLDVTIPASQNFEVPTVSAPDPVASIVRDASGYDYTLTIDIDGTVRCVGVAPANVCARLGCPGNVCN